MAPRRKPREGIQQDRHWHRLPVGAPVHEHVVTHGQALMELDATRHAKNRARERIYEGQALRRFLAARAAIERAGINYADLNATQTVIDTFVSRLSKDRPMPGLMTDGADWEIKRKARQFRQFIVGKMTETEFDDLSREALQDGAILGTGWTRIDDGDDDVFAERMLDNEVLFDRRECRYGAPRTGITVKRIARDHLAALYPKFKAEIDRAEPSRQRPDDQDDDETSFAETDLEDYVDVFEGIRLPSQCEAGDGHEALCIEGATLRHNEWHEPRFPWAMFRLRKPRRGLRGKGFVDQLAKLQERVNNIVRDLQMNLTAFGRGFWTVNEANDVPIEMLSGWQPFKLKYRGPSPPKIEMPQPFNPAQLSMLEFFLRQMFELTGVSQSAATSRSSLGPGASGVALDTQYDIDSDRFRLPQSNYARYRLDGAQCYLDAAARVARRRSEEKGKKRSWIAQSWRSRDEIEQLDYDEVSLKEAQYKLKIEPLNFLPDTRAGKLSVVEQLAKAGVIPQWLVPTLFDDPDLVQASRITLSAFRNCVRKMDMLADRKKEAPVPCAYNDLELELKIAIAYYNFVEEDGAPEEVLDRYDTYIKLVELLIKKKKEGDASLAAPPPMPGAEGAPPMDPAMPPMPGGVPMMPQGPMPAPMPIGAPPMPMAGGM
jgi:hypothetical protein